MGKIKSKSIKRAADALVKQKIGFSDNFEENKKMRALYFGNKDVLDWESDRKRQR